MYVGVSVWQFVCSCVRMCVRIFTSCFYVCTCAHVCVYVCLFTSVCERCLCGCFFFMFVYVRVNEFVCVRAFFSFVRCVCMDACMCVFCAQARGRVCFFVLCEYLYSCVFVCFWLFVPACVRPCVYILKFPCEGV